ncbi:MAG: transpeptidase family protein [Treponematales bacterium]
MFVCLFSVAAAGVLARYGYLMLGPQIPRTNAPRNQAAGRGPILDRNGRVLALETRTGNISVWRPDIKNRGELAKKLSHILEIPEEEILERVNNSTSDFLYLKKQADDATLQLVEAVQREERLSGIGIEASSGRIYPEGKLASQIIGFVGAENSGLGGIEYAFEKDLAAKDAAAQPGGRVYLTLDVNVQHILENIAEKVLDENSADAVMLMALDPRTGDVLGSASLPNFDPNNVRESDEAARMDRPAIWAYEPGSVFKVFSLAALMDTEAIDANSAFFCNGRYERTTNRGEEIVINCLGNHGTVTAREIIIYSCNAGAAYASERLDSGAFYHTLRSFGFGARTNSGIPGETAGFLRPSAEWSERSKPTIAMGQEIAVSALQMLQAATAVANDGVLVPLRIVSRVVSPDGKTREFRAGEPQQVLRAETARAMRSYMMDGTRVGIGRPANVGDLPLAVKTGTAQIIDPRTGAYSPTDFVASCMALLPADSPSLVLYMVVVRPRGASIFGSRIAAPAIRETAEALVDYLGIPRGRNPQVIHPGSFALEPAPPVEVDGVVPDFTGLPKRSLFPLVLRDDIRVEISGEGWVVRQSPAPGERVTADMVIRLELE